MGDRVDWWPAGSVTVQVGSDQGAGPPGHVTRRSDAPFVAMDVLARIAPTGQDA